MIDAYLRDGHVRRFARLLYIIWLSMSFVRSAKVM